MALGPCSSCRRHVRSDATSCPFCGASVTITTTASATTRLSRAAVMAFTTLGAGLGVAVSGCPKTPDPVVQPYGAPPTPTPPDDAGSDSDLSISPGGPVALYGAAPPPEQDAMAVPIVPPYGAPSPTPTLH